MRFFKIVIGDNFVELRCNTIKPKYFGVQASSLWKGAPMRLENRVSTWAKTQSTFTNILGKSISRFFQELHDIIAVGMKV